MTWMARLTRKIQLAALARAAPTGLRAVGERRLLRAFRRAAAGTPAYAALLRANGVEPGQINGVEAMLAQCPVPTKASTFGRFSLEALCLPGTLGQLAGVLALLPWPQDGLDDRITQWPYCAFPFGMRLDYERKFRYRAAEPRPEKRG